jgi:DNA-binding CsgD family transcriptional regulator
LIVTAAEAHASTADQLGHPANQILYGLAIRVLDGYGPSVRPLRAALAAFQDREPDPRMTRRLHLARLIAADLWDEQAWLGLARCPAAGTALKSVMPIGDGAYGALVTSPLGPMEMTLHGLAVNRPPSGSPVAAPTTRSHRSIPSVWGRASRLEDLLALTSERARGHDETVAGAVAAAVLHNAATRYDQAVDAVRAAWSEHPGFTGWALAELVEAAVRTGEADLAGNAAARLAERTAASGTDWALGVQAMTDALLADGQHAEAHYRTAIERLSRTGMRCQLARAELLYGEWLRRQSRRIDARAQLRSANEHFATLGAVTFAERAHSELLATGEAPRKRNADSRPQLTPQETRVASLARAGYSNAEIAERVFVSMRTVEYHLYKAFAKLGVNSRAKLQSTRDR